MGVDGKVQLSVAAIIPCYNGAAFLAEAIQSVQSQTRPVDEILVVDDGSTDDSAAIAQSLGAEVLSLPKNLGAGPARNHGLRHVRSDLVAWLDADDYWLDHHVATLVPLLEHHPQAVAALAAVRVLTGEEVQVNRGYVPPGEPVKVLLSAYRDWLHLIIGCIVRRDPLLQIGGFDESERYSEDFDYWLRLAYVHPFVSTHEVTSCWRHHPGQQSKFYEDQLKAAYRYRRRFCDRVRQDGDHDLVQDLARETLDIWRKDLREAWDEGKLKQFWTVQSLGAGLPNLTLAARLRAVVAAMRTRAGT
jgi:glycosyltransferase involved in cell wall biosynthesis